MAAAKKTDVRKTAPRDQASEKWKRIIIIGKTGNGCSTLGNLLLDKKEDDFHVGVGMSSQTTEEKSLSNSWLKVTDTPDFVNEQTSTETIRRHVSTWKDTHVILLTIRCDVRYTPEEFAIYKKIKELWGNDEDFCQKLMVAFTFGDTLDEKIEEVLRNVGPNLKRVIEDAKNRYFVVPSDTKSQNTRQQIIKQIKDFMVPETKGYIVIIGKTHNGKSRLGNLLLGVDGRFKEGRTDATYHIETQEAPQGLLKVIIIPDHVHLKHDKAFIRKEVDGWKNTTSSAPCLILLAVRNDTEYTSKEFRIYSLMKELWGNDKEFCQRLMVAFTFGDKNSKHDPLALGPDMKSVMEDAEHGSVIFSKADKDILSVEKVRACMNDLATSIKGAHRGLPGRRGPPGQRMKSIEYAVLLPC